MIGRLCDNISFNSSHFKIFSRGEYFLKMKGYPSIIPFETPPSKHSGTFRYLDS